MRGLCALWVFAFHVIPGGFGPLRMASYGYVGVDMFFMLSGYVLMQTHGAEFRAPGLPVAIQFLRRRLWRTYPLYAACVLLSLAAWPLLRSTAPSGVEIGAAVLLLEGWALPGIGVNSPVWSLGVEWLGYAAFPLIAFLVGRLPVRAALAALLAVLAGEVVALWGWGAPQYDLNIAGLPAVIRMAGGFVAGCLVWAAQQAQREAPTSMNDALLLASLIGTMLIWLTLPVVFGIPALAAWLYFVARPGPLASRLLGNGICQFLGRISFALYLTHLPVVKLLQLAGGGLRGPAGTLLACAVSGSVALAFCLLIEEPARRLGRRTGWNAAAASVSAPGAGG